MLYTYQFISIYKYIYGKQFILRSLRTPKNKLTPKNLKASYYKTHYFDYNFISFSSSMFLNI